MSIWRVWIFHQQSVHKIILVRFTDMTKYLLSKSKPSVEISHGWYSFQFSHTFAFIVFLGLFFNFNSHFCRLFLWFYWLFQATFLLPPPYLITWFPSCLSDKLSMWLFLYPLFFFRSSVSCYIHMVFVHLQLSQVIDYQLLFTFSYITFQSQNICLHNVFNTNKPSALW